MARLWRNAAPNADGEYVTEIGEVCLCSSVNTLRSRGSISDYVRDQMLSRLHDEAERLDRDPDNYLWPLDAKGAAARVRFCERQAKALTRTRASRTPSTTAG